MATRFLKILSNGNKIFRSKQMTAPSYMMIFNFSFPFSIGFDSRNLQNLQKLLETLLFKIPSSILQVIVEKSVKVGLEAFKNDEFTNETLERLQGLNFIQRSANGVLEKTGPIDDIIKKDLDRYILKNIANQQAFCHEVIGNQNETIFLNYQIALKSFF